MAFDNPPWPRPPNGAEYISAAGNLAKQLSDMFGGLGDAYQSGRNFQYQQRQQNLFQNPDSQAALQDAIKTGDYSRVLQSMIQAQGASAAPVIGQLMSDQAGARLASAISGGGEPQGQNTNPTAPAAGSPSQITGQPSLPSAGSDSAGAETVRSLTAGIAGGRAVPDATIGNYARAIGVDPDTPLSADQKARVTKIIGNNLRGSGQQPMGSASTGGISSPAVTRANPVPQSGLQDEGNVNQGTPVGSSGGVGPITPAPTSASGAIAGTPAPQPTFNERFGAATPGVRPTPVGTEAQAREAETRAKNMRALQAYYAGRNPKAAEAIGARAAEEEKRAHEIRDSIAKYNEPGTQPQVQASLKQYEKAGEAQGKVIGDYIDAGRSASKRIQLLDTVGDALTRGHGNITTGPFHDFALAAKQTISSIFGIPFEGVAEAEVAKKTGFALATQAVKEITSRPTQMEVKQALENNPGLLLSEKGSALMIDVMKQSARQDQELAKLAGNRKNWDNWQDVVDKFYKEHPLLSPFDHKKMLSMDDIKAIQPQNMSNVLEKAANGEPVGGTVKRYRWTPEGLQPK